MRKRTLALTTVVAFSLLTFSILWLTSKVRRSPTPFGWHPYVTIVAGDGTPMLCDVAQASHAAFIDPFGVAVSKDGTVYVSDAGTTNRIRKIKSNEGVTTLAGGVEGFADGLGSQASFNTPSALALDPAGNILVADTGNNRIRRVTPEGLVSTVAGDGAAGYVDAPAAQARFDGPVGIAVDSQSVIYVADTYNDRIRKITPDGQVNTVAGGGRPGHQDGGQDTALFDTPAGIAVTPDGSLIVADTGNNCLRKIGKDGHVTTLSAVFPNEVSPADLRKPIGLAVTHDGFLYVTELDRARVIQVAPDGSARVIANNDGDGIPFAQLTSVAVNPLTSDLIVADSGNYIIRKLAHSDASAAARAASPQSLVRLAPAMLGQQSVVWPIDPQEKPHEVVATMGEVRGSFNSDDSRHHLHSGLDVFGVQGELVRVVRPEKVTSPLPNWAFDDLSEGLRVAIMSYIHILVGRDKDGKLFDDRRFIPVTDENGKLVAVRIRRGTQFRIGDAIGTVNRMYHVHMNVGPPGGEINPLSLAPVGFTDHVAPVIEKDGIQLFSEDGVKLSDKQNGRLTVNGRVRIVVNAFDRTDMNPERRRLGLYSIGYQVLNLDGVPAQGFQQPRINIVFDRLPANMEAVKVAYAQDSGITVYGSDTTRFLYEVTNVVRGGNASHGVWDTSDLPKGDYILRIIAADYSGNVALEGRDVQITLH
jgi:sugar lactone lactonase YvrE